MSTILRALQKVEKETTEDADQPGPGPTHSIKPTQTINQRLTALWYLQLGKRYLLIGSGAIMLVLLAIFTFSMLGSDPPPETASQNRAAPNRQPIDPGWIPQGSPAPAANRPEHVAKRHRATRPPDYAPAPSYDPNHQPGQYASKYAAAPQAQMRPSTDTERQVEPPLEMETISPSLAEEETAKDGAGDEDLAPDDSLPPESTEPEAPVEILESDPEELRYAQVDLLEESTLELQAISYSTVPKQRMAVINNEIIHQGRKVGGYKVIYIGPEQVVVEKGGSQWKIIFMVR